MIDISQTSPSEPWLELCLEQPDKESTDIRVEDLLHSLNALKNMIYLLAASHATSETPMRPLPANSVVRRDFESTFDLVCKQTRPGSYVVPLSIRTKRVPDEYIEHTEASERFGLDLTLAIEKTIQVISTGDQTKINDHLPEPSNRKRILEAISALSPSAKIKAVLRKPSKDEPLWLYNSGECQKNVKQMIKTAMLETRQLQSKESTVIAEIEKIDAKAKLFRARTEDGLVIDGRLDREFPDGQCLLPPKYIEIDGTFEIDGDDIERSVITQTEKRLLMTQILVLENSR